MEPGCQCVPAGSTTTARLAAEDPTRPGDPWPDGRRQRLGVLSLGDRLVVDDVVGAGLRPLPRWPSATLVRLHFLSTFFAGETPVALLLKLDHLALKGFEIRCKLFTALLAE